MASLFYILLNIKSEYKNKSQILEILRESKLFYLDYLIKEVNFETVEIILNKTDIILLDFLQPVSISYIGNLSVKSNGQT